MNPMSLLPALLVSLVGTTSAQWTAVLHRSNQDSPKREVAMSSDASKIILRSQDEGYLGGGFNYFSFSPLFAEGFQFDEHIFQMGWFNHQLGITS